ncbi:MAG: hypothetical protein FWC66_08195, partial [Oscillospiraceae bacterium]|nr:hypothetical protein [Oscillospiraceae bacterium]
MDQITEQGMCWTMIIFDYDPAVLGNPRLSPRIERSALTSELQEAYDNLSGTLFETVLGPFRGGNAVLHNMIFEGVFSWNRGEVIVSWQSNPNPDIPDNFTSGIFVDVRFDILATAPFGESPIMFSQRPSNIFLAGVGTVVIPIVWESFSNGSTTVIFDLPEVRILNQHGNLITTASLTAARNGVTPVLSMDIIPGTGVDAGRFAVDGATIGDVFTASASGFQSASRTLSTTDVMANYIEIVLTHYANVPVTVHVMEGTRFVENATLVLQGNNVSGSGGIFNVMLSGRNVGNILTAAAQGLGYEEHTITFEDLVHPATIVINLTRQNVGLTITNVPGSLTHVNQTGTAGAGASETALMFDGTSNAVMFGSPVALSAGAVEEHHYFLGWYRGATAPTAGTPVSALTGVVTAENHTFNMPAEGLQYFALWGARGVIGNRSPRITFNIYGSMKNNAPGVLPARVRNSLPGGASGYTNQIAVPMVFGESLCLLAMEPIIEWMGGQESGFAFWGWFTEEALDASGRSRNSYRRPTVGTNGFDISRVFTEALFNTYADADNNINLNAIWALWGDVNDDDQINGLDVSLVSQHVRRFPGISIVEPAAHVSRGPAITGLDVSLISQYVRRFPGIVLGQPSSRALVLGAQMRLPDVSAPEIWDRASAFSGTTATSVLAANAPQTRSGGGIQRNTIGAHQIWSVSHEIGYRGDYVDIRLRMDQITAQGMCWT